MRRGIGEWIDDLQLLNDRTGPSVSHDQRQRVFVPRTNVDEMDVDAIDLSHEHGQRVQLGLHLSPVVLRAPVADHLLQFRELRALRPVIDSLLVRPRVAAMRRRSSSSSAWGTWTVNGRIELSSGDWCAVRA